MDIDKIRKIIFISKTAINNTWVSILLSITLPVIIYLINTYNDAYSVTNWWWYIEYVFFIFILIGINETIKIWNIIDKESGKKAMIRKEKIKDFSNKIIKLSSIVTKKIFIMKVLKILVTVIVGILLILSITNPSMKDFEEYTGMKGIDRGIYIKRTSNYLIYSIYENDEGDTPMYYTGILLNFYKR
jgi:hypothetical protein